jgi:hypothetical protein
MDRGANEVFCEGADSRIFVGSYKVLEDIKYYHVSDGQSDGFWTFYEQNDEVLSKIETETIAEWFAACWNQAGGAALNRPLTLVFMIWIPALIYMRVIGCDLTWQINIYGNVLWDLKIGKWAFKLNIWWKRRGKRRFKGHYRLKRQERP